MQCAADKRMNERRWKIPGQRLLLLSFHFRGTWPVSITNGMGFFLRIPPSFLDVQESGLDPLDDGWMKP